MTLWRLAALNPALSPIERDDLDTQIREWHIQTVDKVRKGRPTNVGGGNNAVRKADVEVFSGFKPAIEACKLDWCDYVITGVTYQDSYRAYWKFSHAVIGNRLSDTESSKKSSRGKGGVKGVITSQVMCPVIVQSLHNAHERQPQADGAYSSSSEGFCESDRRDSVVRPQDSDSDLGDIEGAQAKGTMNRGQPSGRPENLLGPSGSGQLPIVMNVEQSAGNSRPQVNMNIGSKKVARLWKSRDEAPEAMVAMEVAAEVPVSMAASAVPVAMVPEAAAAPNDEYQVSIIHAAALFFDRII